jgi:hypothetical protein
VELLHRIHRFDAWAAINRLEIKFLKVVFNQFKTNFRFGKKKKIFSRTCIQA